MHARPRGAAGGARQRAGPRRRPRGDTRGTKLAPPPPGPAKPLQRVPAFRRARPAELCGGVLSGRPPPRAALSGGAGRRRRGGVGQQPAGSALYAPHVSGGCWAVGGLQVLVLAGSQGSCMANGGGTRPSPPPPLHHAGPALPSAHRHAIIVSPETELDLGKQTYQQVVGRGGGLGVVCMRTVAHPPPDCCLLTALLTLPPHPARQVLMEARREGTLLPARHPAVQAVRRVGTRVAQVRRLWDMRLWMPYCRTARLCWMFGCRRNLRVPARPHPWATGRVRRLRRRVPSPPGGAAVGVCGGGLATGAGLAALAAW